MKAYSDWIKQFAHKGTIDNADNLLYKALNQGALVNSELLD